MNLRTFLLKLHFTRIVDVNFAFSLYDTQGTGSVDAYFLGDLLRACSLNPTNALIEKMGGLKKKGEVIARLNGKFVVIFIYSLINKVNQLFSDGTDRC